MTGYSAELPPERFNLARYCLAASAQAAPRKPALIVANSLDPNGADAIWCYAELEDEVLRLAGGLSTFGLRRGERLLIRMHNTPDYALLFFAAAAAGLVPIPASTRLTTREVEFITCDSGAVAVAASGDLQLSETAAKLPRLSAQAIAGLKRTAPRGDYADTGKDDPAFLIYTSGTSGMPKGVLHAHRVVWGRRPMYEGWYGIGANDIMLHTGAFNWTYTLGVGMFDPWANGATTVLYTGPGEIRVWPELIARHRATIMAAVPTLYRQLLKYCELPPDRLATLRHGLTAGEPLPASVAEEWERRVGVPLYEALGMSEISTYISSSPSVAVKRGSPGKPQAGRCVAILPVDGGTEPLPPGETGLIAVHRSDPGLMLGYWNNDEEERAVMRGEWFCGGDLGLMDEDGYVWFKGRNDDVMNAMGYRVSPEEVEAVLDGHPDVAEVAVSELPVRADVSVIAAFVVTAGGAPGDAEALAAYAAERLAAYKCPREFVFVDKLPRTANGKIIRKALKEMAPGAT